MVDPVVALVDGKRVTQTKIYQLLAQVDVLDIRLVEPYKIDCNQVPCLVLDNRVIIDAGYARTLPPQAWPRIFLAVS